MVAPGGVGSGGHAIFQDDWEGYTPRLSEGARDNLVEARSERGSRFQGDDAPLADPQIATAQI